MPNSIHPLNRVIFTTVVAALGFFALATSLPLDFLIAFLNGVFMGCMAAIALAYWPLVTNAVLGVRPYDRVRQMTLGFALCWAAYIISVALSIYLRASDGIVSSSMITAFSRYVAIIAAVLQVTAPDFGLGIFHGRDRKVLYTGISVGLAVAAVIVFMQELSILVF